jgi:Sulfatase
VTTGTAGPSAAAADPRNPEAPSRLRAELRRLLELFVLCGFVVAQPLFDVAGRSPEFFLYRRAGAADILPLVALAVLGPPAVLWMSEALAGLAGRGPRRAAHLAVVAGLLLLLAIEVAKRLTPVRGSGLLLVGVAGGLTGAVVYARSRAGRLWLRYATPAPLVFALLFLTVSPVGRLVVAGDQHAGSASGSAPAGARPPVVVVFFDEFPMRSLLDSRGRIDRRLFPNFARFAGDATWYRNATGVSPFTPDAVPAMLSGRYPSRPDVAPIYTQYPGTLFTLLAGSYDVRASESVTQLCPPRVCAAPADTGRARGWRGLGRDLAGVWVQIVSPRRSDEDPIDQFSEDTVGDRVRAAGATDGKLTPKFRFDQLRANQPARFADFLQGLKASDRPTLHFLHLLLPHQPFKFLPSGARYTYPPVQFGYDKLHGWTSQPAPVQLALQRHLLQLAYTDRLVGEVVRRLKAQGLYDKALVVITADHGNSFSSGHLQRLLQPGNAHELLWVPLLIKAPHQRTPRVDDRNWEHVDLLPTIADLLRVEVPWRVDGVSALAPERSRRAKWFFNQPNQRLEVDGPSNQALALRGITDRFARPQHGVEGLFQVGPYADLVGRRPEAVGLAGGSGLAARLEPHENESLKAVDPATGTVPALVTGALTGPLPDAPVPLAVAVNGTIGAVGLTFTQDATPQTFAMVVPERLFHPGVNRVRLYRVERVGAGTTLHPVELAG